MVEERTKDICMLLIYLTGWEEDRRNGQPGEKIFRSWSGYSFDILKELQARKLIIQYYNAKSIIITEEGRRLAEEIRRKLFNTNEPLIIKQRPQH
ncbi:MAG: DUF6429 family protein [Candidatus Omnitrophota bacterium]